MIFSHQFNPFVRLSFEEDRFSTLTFSDFNLLLRESRYLRAVDLPHPPPANDSRQLLHSFRMILKSERLSMYYSGFISMSALHTIFLIHRLVDVRIGCCMFVSPYQELTQEFASFFQSLLHEDSLLQRLRVALDLRSERLALQMVDSFTACSSKKLNLFCIEDLFSYSAHSFAQVKPWDIGLFPCVALNCYRNCLQKHMKGGVMPWAIQAVNKGQVYRKATSHAAFDMSIANAGVIFCIVHEQAKHERVDKSPETGLK
jgi:hypothetical protein